MFRINHPVRRVCVALVGLALVACSGESKPVAQSPTPSSAVAASSEAAPSEPAAAPSPGATPVKVVDGQAPGDDRYAVQIVPPSEATPGQEGEVIVRVVPKEPWHMNLDFPTSLRVTPPAGLTLANAELKKADARTLDADSCEFAIKFTPQQAGDHAVSGTFKFAVCQDEACSPVSEDVEFMVAVK